MKKKALNTRYHKALVMPYREVDTVVVIKPKEEGEQRDEGRRKNEGKKGEVKSIFCS